MKSKIFNSEEIQAIIAGKKTMFREVIKTESELKVGQEIFVKETFAKWRNNSFVYKADITPEKVVSKWSLPQHMKQEQSRITLKIKSVKVERLQDISEKNAIKEGFEAEEWIETDAEGIRCGNGFDAVQVFEYEWSVIHKKPEEKWKANPWVFAYEFEIINLKK